MRLEAMPATKNGYAVPDQVRLTALLKLTKVKKFNNCDKHYGKANVIHDAQCVGTLRQPVTPVPDQWDQLIVIGNVFK
jgi:hypothetical protein